MGSSSPIKKRLVETALNKMIKKKKMNKFKLLHLIISSIKPLIELLPSKNKHDCLEDRKELLDQVYDSERSLQEYYRTKVIEDNLVHHDDVDKIEVAAYELFQDYYL